MNNRNYKSHEKGDFDNRYNRNTNRPTPYQENRNHSNYGHFQNHRNYDDRNYDYDNRNNSDYFEDAYMNDYENDDDFHRYDPRDRYFNDDSEYFDHEPYGRRDNMNHRYNNGNNSNREDYERDTNDHQNSEPHYGSGFRPSTRNRVNINEENLRNDPYSPSLNSNNNFEENRRFKENYLKRNNEYIPRYMDSRYSDYRDNRDNRNTSTSRKNDSNENRRRAGFGERMRD